MRIEKIKTNGSAEETGKLMREMVDRYYTDMLPFVSCSLINIFDFIKRIPYRPDPPNEETLMRPRYTMKSQGWGGDCDDKCIALASWAKLRSIPFRFIAVRKINRTKFHHVLCELYINNTWVTADPTYSFNTLGKSKEVYAEKKVIG